MKKKAALSISFLASLLPMLLNQYGGMKGVQEITGLVNLFNPIGVIAVITFFAGVFMKLEERNVNRIMCAIGTVGIVISEVYKFFTWHVMTITGEISLKNSLRFAFPEFYIGLAVSLMMIIVYFFIERNVKE